MVRETVSQGIGYAVPDIMVVTRASKVTARQTLPLRASAWEVSWPATATCPLSLQNGTYWTVDVGPVEVKTQEQVIQIYAALRADPRTKFMI